MSIATRAVRIVLAVTIITWIVAWGESARGDSYTILHQFLGPTGDGAHPYGSLTRSGSTLYGMTYEGGPGDGDGVVFKINTDGTGYTILETFDSSGPDDPSHPYGSLTLLGSTLYGMSYFGGIYGHGDVFKMNTDGTGLTILHSFEGPPDSSRNPRGSLTLSGSTLYGTTYYGGSDDIGTVFQINTDGTSYELLHSFTGSPDDGKFPIGAVTVSGSMLYGLAGSGGLGTGSGNGVLFRMNADGPNCTILHYFEGLAFDGENPRGSLTLSDTMLYGLAYDGGLNDDGVLFRVNTDGTGYRVLYDFDDTSGGSPFGSLTLSGSRFYGMTYQGGTNNTGVVFQMNTDGTDYTVLHNFLGVNGDGANPYYGELVMYNGTLYGMTAEGGQYGKGVIFSLQVPEPATVTLIAFGGLLPLLCRRKSS